MRAQVPPSVKLITLVVVRQTLGWHRLDAAISIKDFEHYTGLSHQTVIEAIKLAVSKGFIFRHVEANSRTYSYALLNSDDVLRLTSKES
jgi:hypothetical protein